MQHTPEYVCFEAHKISKAKILLTEHLRKGHICELCDLQFCFFHILFKLITNVFPYILKSPQHTYSWLISAKYKHL